MTEEHIDLSVIMRMDNGDFDRVIDLYDHEIDYWEDDIDNLPDVIENGDKNFMDLIELYFDNSEIQ